jgi:CHAT domain-containing protein
MVAFYRGLTHGRSAAAALQDAKLESIRAGKPPQYWAPFVLIGE